MKNNPLGETTTPGNIPAKRKMSAAGRRRIKAAQKARWAKKRAEAAGTGETVAQPIARSRRTAKARATTIARASKLAPTFTEQIQALLGSQINATTADKQSVVRARYEDLLQIAERQLQTVRAFGTLIGAERTMTAGGH